MIKNKEKQKFLEYLGLFRNELEDLQAYIEDYKTIDKYIGTLADLGFNISYKMANIGFELGYATWFFIVDKNDFKTTKKCFLDTILSNEKIEKVYTEKELEKIIKRIENC